MDANTLVEDVLFAFVAVDIQLANARICLTDGIPEVSFPVNGNSITFTSFDPIYGVLTAFDDVTTGISDEAPSSTISIAPATSNAVAEYCDPRNQTRKVVMYFGLYDPDAGEVISVDAAYTWQIDYATIKSGQDNGGNVMIDLHLNTPWDKFFNSDNGDRLNLTYQQRLRPGEEGLKWMTSPSEEIWWGSGDVNISTSKASPTSKYTNIYNR